MAARRGRRRPRGAEPGQRVRTPRRPRPQSGDGSVYLVKPERTVVLPPSRRHTRGAGGTAVGGRGSAASGGRRSGPRQHSGPHAGRGFAHASRAGLGRRPAPRRDLRPHHARWPLSSALTGLAVSLLTRFCLFRSMPCPSCLGECLARSRCSVRSFETMEGACGVGEDRGRRAG